MERRDKAGERAESLIERAIEALDAEPAAPQGARSDGGASESTGELDLEALAAQFLRDAALDADQIGPACPADPHRLLPQPAPPGPTRLTWFSIGFGAATLFFGAIAAARLWWIEPMRSEQASEPATASALAAPELPRAAPATSPRPPHTGPERTAEEKRAATAEESSAHTAGNARADVTGNERRVAAPRVEQRSAAPPTKRAASREQRRTKQRRAKRRSRRARARATAAAARCQRAH